MIGNLFPHTVTVVTTAEITDTYGNVKRAAGTTSVQRGFMDRVVSTEALNDRDTVRTLWRCFLPAGVVIGAYDRIQWNGTTYQVTGEPFKATSAVNGAVHHIEVDLERTS